MTRLGVPVGLGDVPAGTVVGPDVVVPGSQQLVPALLVLVSVAAVAVAGSLALRRRWRSRRDRRNGPPIGVIGAVSVAVVAATGAWATRPPEFFVPRFGALPDLVPEDNVFRRSAVDLPVSADSTRWISSIADRRLGVGFGGRVVDGVVFGIPYNFVDGRTPRHDVDIVGQADSSFPGPYPITDPAYIESMPTYGFDMHYVGVDPTSAEVWELLSTRAWFGRWQADSGAHYRTGSNAYPRGSTIAAGLPLLPGTITYAEVASGRVDHVVLSAIDTTASGRSTWPARSTDGRSTDPDAPPQGAWLRLRSDTDLSGLGRQARVIAEAMQAYGTVLSDTGPGFRLRGTPDARWDDEDLATLGTLSAADFEVVDPSGIRVSEGELSVLPSG